MKPRQRRHFPVVQVEAWAVLDATGQWPPSQGLSGGCIKLVLATRGPVPPGLETVVSAGMCTLLLPAITSGPLALFPGGEASLGTEPIPACLWASGCTFAQEPEASEPTTVSCLVSAGDPSEMEEGAAGRTTCSLRRKVKSS